jgi:hypothetical protein
MATAFLLPLSNLFASLQALASLFAPRPAVAYGSAGTPVHRPVWQGPVRQPPAQPQPQPAKPLRVLRVVEPSAPGTVAGRMVISGRMADVCAELDRLAALEAR